jgi:CheY-like chemotaxis protein
MTSTRSNGSNPPRPRVLVIDDDEVALEAIREVLVDAGFEPHCLSSPIGATSVIVTQGIEAVVVDLNMPVMSGDRFISLLRSWDRIRDLPAVLISESSQDTLDGIAGILSAVRTVTKSNMRQALPQALQRLLARDRVPAGLLRSSSEQSAEEQEQLARAAHLCTNLLSSMNSGRQQGWAPLLHELRLLRDRTRNLAPQLHKLMSKAFDTAEFCSRRQRLSPEARLALRGTLELVIQPETIASSNQQALQSVHFTRLQRACEEIDK